MNYLDLEIKPGYISFLDDIPKDFLVPLLNCSVMYKRAVGFFSSTALIEIISGINSLVRNGGKIQIIASPKLSSEDVEAIDFGYKNRTEVIEQTVLREIIPPSNEFDKERLNLLANLIADGTLDIKIAFIEENSSIGIFHEKMGILEDKDHNTVVFSGSMNETITGYYGNYETIDVFCSWKTDFECIKITEKTTRFEKQWGDKLNKIRVIEFPEIAKEELKKYMFSNTGDALKGVERFPSDPIKNRNVPVMPVAPELRDYQNQAIAAWKENNFRGVFDMATGTGKTFTGIAAIVELFNHLNNSLFVVIVCPFQHLVDQWIEDLNAFNIFPVIGHSGSVQKDYKRRLKETISNFNFGVIKFGCFICTNSTFISQAIQADLETIVGKLLIVADEAHNLGAPNTLKNLKEIYQYRLALSATFDRHNDPEGTRSLYDYFGEKCFEYSLEKAIFEKKLSPYKYYPRIVPLEESELERYDELTEQIKKCTTSDRNGNPVLNEKGKLLAIKRARVIAGAVGKIKALLTEMERYKDQSHILVYCGAAKVSIEDENINDDTFEEERQIEIITGKIWETYKMKVSQFTSNESSQERAGIKRDFETGDSLQVLVAIKCLDEGVNIPKIKTAFILASTTNPKEYIQRRGRVLRLSEDKEYAEIYDFVTIPRKLSEVIDLPMARIQNDYGLIKNELRRVVEFKRLSLNPIDSDKMIDEILNTYHFNISDIYQ